jgi:hypothetical protein
VGYHLRRTWRTVQRRRTPRSTRASGVGLLVRTSTRKPRPMAGPYVRVLAYTGCCCNPRAPPKREEGGPSGLTEAPTHRRGSHFTRYAWRRDVCPLAVLPGLCELGLFGISHADQCRHSGARHCFRRRFRRGSKPARTERAWRADRRVRGIGDRQRQPQFLGHRTAIARRGCTGEDHGTAPARQHSARSLAAHQKFPEITDPPRVLGRL